MKALRWVDKELRETIAKQEIDMEKQRKQLQHFQLRLQDQERQIATWKSQQANM